jgi:hypothetical protein
VSELEGRGGRGGEGAGSGPEREQVLDPTSPAEIASALRVLMCVCVCVAGKRCAPAVIIWTPSLIVNLRRSRLFVPRIIIAQTVTSLVGEEESNQMARPIRGRACRATPLLARRA